MLKRCIMIFAVLCFYFCLYAGDAAQFADIGFSADGSVYMFGEYGVTDKAYQAYAAIYAVETAKNDFVKDGIFKIGPTTKTAEKNALTIYKDLFLTATAFMKARKVTENANSALLYVSPEDGTNPTHLEFRDFATSTMDNQVSYSIKIAKLIEGSGANAVSSFYLIVEKKLANGSIIRKIAGSPQIKRNGVTDYGIYRIFCDNSGKNLAFIIEKTVVDSNGISIRYMAETLVL